LAAAFGTDPLEGCQQAVAMIGAFEVAVHLTAQRALGNWVIVAPPDVQGAVGGALDGNLPATGVRAVVRTDTGDDGDGWIMSIAAESGHGNSFGFGNYSASESIFIHRFHRLRRLSMIHL
jgi:hypothetical protein